MEKNIQAIVDLITQTQNLSVEEKASILVKLIDTDKKMALAEFKLDRTEKVKRTTTILLEETIAELEQKRKAVEAQNRELEIEAALERMRTVAMGMAKPDDLMSICEIMFHELKKLGFGELRNAMIDIHYDEKEYLLNYDYAEHSGQTVHQYIYHTHTVIDNLTNHARQSNAAFTEMVYSGEALNEWRSFRKKSGEVDDARFDNLDALYYYFYSIGTGAIGISMFKSANEGQLNVLKRFRNVFDLSYKRYVDITNAAARAREAQIEAALERVRSRGMGMQKSNELREVIQIVFEQFVYLEINLDHAGFVVDYVPNGDWHFWIADKQQIPSKITHPYFESVWANQFNEAKRAKTDFFATKLDFEEKNKFYKELLSYVPDVPEESRQFYLNSPGIAVSTALSDNVSLYIENFSGIPYSDEDNTVIKRIEKVFQQTYTRFLDLEKAEAQAREAQIEAALEQVRSRSLAMHKSDDVIDVARSVFEKLDALGVELNTAFIIVFANGSRDSEWWLINKDDQQYSKVFVRYTDLLIFREQFQAREEGKDLFTATYSFDEKTKLFKYLFTETDFKYAPPERQKYIFESNAISISMGLSEKIGIQITRHTDRPFSHDENEILKRFARIFNQSYTRFLDLQKAEAQTRESQIELSLERVRAKTMAMHNSADVGETAAVMVSEIKKLGIETILCGIGIMHPPGDMEVWTIRSDDNDKTDIIIGWLDMHIHPLLRGASESWSAKNEVYSYQLKDEDLLAFYAAITAYPGYPIRYDLSALPGLIYHNEFTFAEGILFSFSLQQLAEEERKIFKRFAGVFGQTYRRYLDLKNAEAQAKESQIEAALERVRSRTLAMQRSDELAETSAVLFRQMIGLGISPNRLYICIVKDEEGDTEFWITDEDGSKVSMAYEDNLNNNSSFRKMLDGWKQQRKSLVIDMEGRELEEYFEHLSSIHVPFKGGLSQKRRIQYVSYFSNGFIGMASPAEQPPQSIELLNRFAYVFNLTFSRFNDLKGAEAHAVQAEQDLVEIKAARKKAEDTLTELQITQRQLIQAEKMASLGELTAGIAHEIQNPLNFVNNFSEVSDELIKEMKEELAIGNNQQASEIANDISNNLQKISHHGKRADAIVKGMLQHSRNGSGQKELTDINVLCDEYLRLAYHGFRAKEKGFNSEFKTDFDSTLERINIVPQDFGRVILNLLNNAFYAVTDRKKSAGDIYKPVVSIETRKVDAKADCFGVQVRVEDNGSGIPRHIVDKIFQPFFTTKPTGQGTGLGLSLAYDIITKEYNGTIKVETKGKEGSAFVIRIPAL